MKTKGKMRNQCSTCNGTGWEYSHILNKEVLCQTCNGSGKKATQNPDQPHQQEVNPALIIADKIDKAMQLIIMTGLTIALSTICWFAFIFPYYQQITPSTSTTPTPNCYCTCPEEDPR